MKIASWYVLIGVLGFTCACNSGSVLGTDDLGSGVDTPDGGIFDDAGAADAGPNVAPCMPGESVLNPFPYSAMFGFPGLRDSATGAAHVLPPAQPRTGTSRNIVSFGAKPDDGQDDRAAIQSAIDASTSGDEVFIPKGLWNLSSTHPSSSQTGTILQLKLKSGVNLRGEEQASAVLVSNLDCDSNCSNINQFVIHGAGVSKLLLSDFTVTSTWNKTYSTDTNVSNPAVGGPAVAINLAGSGNAQDCFAISVERVTAEKYSRMGFRANGGCHDVAFRSCLAQNSTDVATGGAGYGFVLQGKTHQDPAAGSAPFADQYKNPFLGTPSDNYFNLIEGCRATGPYMRHGALVQYWSHHNAVTNSTFENTQLDSIDLHGDDEYSNEISANVVLDNPGGAGIGMGNSGAGHDKTGANNWVHHNLIRRSLRGISIQFGTAYSVVTNNCILDNTATANGYGLGLGFAARSVVQGNRVEGNTAAKFYGLYLFNDTSTGVSAAYRGSPANNLVDANLIKGNAFGIFAGTFGPQNTITNNQFIGNTMNNSYP